MTATSTPPTPLDDGPKPINPWKILISIVVIGFAAFWIWALFFASKESVNKIGDEAWAERAQGICETADQEREGLVDMRRVDESDPAMVAERGEIVGRATDIVERMLDDVVAVAPTDAKGRALVPEWEADYRTYIENRRAFVELLRSGENGVFTENAVDGIPISEKLARFAADNLMADCAPPIDLAN